MSDDVNSMNELLDKLTANEEAQFKIYDTYRRGADMDLTMRELKKQEQTLRRLIAVKVGM